MKYRSIIALMLITTLALPQGVYGTSLRDKVEGKDDTILTEINTSDKTDEINSEEKVIDQNEKNEALKTYGSKGVNIAENVDADNDVVNVEEVEDEYENEIKTGGASTGKVSNSSGTPIYQTNESKSPVITGTIMRSINNTKGAYYQPKLDTLPWLKYKVAKDTGISTIYDKEFDRDQAELLDTIKANTRETNILGNDLLILKEEVNSDNLSITRIPENGYSGESGVLRQLAVMNCYKALGENEYRVFMKTSPYRGSDGRAVGGTIPIGGTPFSELVGMSDASVNTSAYYTDVFVTRTLPKTYWLKGYYDGLVSSRYTDEDTVGSDKSLYQNENISIGEFCYYVYRMLELNGEPVLNSKETEALLVTYGSIVPTYVPSHQQEAIRYLLARGIVDSDIDFDSDLTCSLMLTILMRAKDKDSRTTFKEMELVYNENLVGKGYTPTEVTQAKGISNIQWEVQGADITYYDYFIKVTPDTKFENTSGISIGTPFVSQKCLEASSFAYDDSKYLGIVDGYYHFQVPVSIESDNQATNIIDDGGGARFFRLDTANESDRPKSLFVEVGGGRYEVAKSIGNNGDIYIRRQRFKNNENPIYIDRERKLSQQSVQTLPIKLTNKNQSILTFQCEDPENVTWKGESLTSNVAKQDGITYDANSKTYTLKTESSDPYGFISKNIETSLGNSKSFPAYVKSGSTFMVSSAYFKSLDANDKYRIDDIYKKDDDTYIIVTKYENIIVKLKNRYVISGQCITQIPKVDDSADLVVPLENESDEYLIDYRVVAGVISGYLVLDTDGTAKSIASTYNDNIGFYPIECHGIMGNDYTVNFRGQEAQNNSSMLLEASFQISNFLLFKKNSNGSSGDYLLVFKPRIKGYDADREATAKTLKEAFDINLGEDDDCTIYSLDSSTTTANPIIKTVNPNTIKKVQGIGYKYIIPDISSFSVEDYYKAPNGNSSPLPIVSVTTPKGKRKIFSLNCNIIPDWELGRYPKSILSTDAIDSLGLTGDLQLNEDGGYVSSEPKELSKPIALQVAPVGLFSSFYETETVSEKDLTSNNAIVLIGSMNGKISSAGSGLNAIGTLKYTSRDYEQKITGREFINIMKVTNADGKLIYLYKPENGTKVNSLDSLASEGVFSFDEGIGLKNYFDWENFSMQELLHDIEDIMTIVYLILIALVPRILIMMMLALASLSLVVDTPPVKVLCEDFIDIYKVLSFGLLDINSIDKKMIWINTFFAIVGFTMINLNLVNEVLAYFHRIVLEILMR